jgi:hypothetical protein
LPRVTYSMPSSFAARSSRASCRRLWLVPSKSRGDRFHICLKSVPQRNLSPISAEHNRFRTHQQPCRPQRLQAMCQADAVVVPDATGFASASGPVCRDRNPECARHAVAPHSPDRGRGGGIILRRGKVRSFGQWKVLACCTLLGPQNVVRLPWLVSDAAVCGGGPVNRYGGL